MTRRELDQADLARRGITESELARQLGCFARPLAWVRLEQPCRPGDGIRQLRPDEVARCERAFDAARLDGRCMTFVPASGAASRMFSGLNRARARVRPMTRDGLAQAARAGDADASDALFFGANVERFAFFPALAAAMQDAGFDARALAAAGRYDQLVDYLVGDVGLGYAARPKGLLAFHVSDSGSRTALQAHLVEAAAYLQDTSGVCRLHLTVSADHLSQFEVEVAATRRDLETRLGVRFDLDLSVQGASTDTVAVDLDNAALRDGEGKLVFRPGGHGALLENLNHLDGDVVFIKNIDNVAPEHMNGPSVHWKRVLGGCLVAAQQEVRRHLTALHAETGEAAVVDALAFLRDTCGAEPGPLLASSLPARRTFAIEHLDRPIRVCGMVPNQGQPGGGPFWVRGDAGGREPQIVETAEVDADAPEQMALLAAATHFNPVDLVCGLRNWRDEPFDLRRFENADRVFISDKPYEGRRVRALEHPGLWNGGMAGWLSLFVEVPPETFSPVKTVNDLLRQEHRPEAGPGG